VPKEVTLSADVQNKYLSYAEYFPQKGLKRLATKVEEVVEMVLSKYVIFGVLLFSLTLSSFAFLF
jgi:hypothetical protein